MLTKTLALLGALVLLGWLALMLMISATAASGVSQHWQQERDRNQLIWEYQNADPSLDTIDGSQIWK